MIGKIIHIGLTVSDIEKSIIFYRDILGLKYIGSMIMDGEETDKLFCKKNCTAKVAYLTGSDLLSSPPVELIQFTSHKSDIDTPALMKTSISELCFEVDNIDLAYHTLKQKGVSFLSEPQFFDFTTQGFGKSKAVYFKDTDGIILELIENIQ